MAARRSAARDLASRGVRAVSGRAAEIGLAVLALLLAWGTAAAVTPRLMEAARRFGIVDVPDGRLKTQKEPVPYLGGLAVALGLLLALGVTYRFGHQLLAVLLGASIVLILGLLDDLGSLKPASKLAGQLLAVLVLIKAGVSIQIVFVPWWVAIPLTVVWMLAATNALNLIDVMDGLSSGVGAVAALFFAGIALAGGLTDTGFLGAALAGGLLGFRRYNVEPARIYLGDTGSLFAGFLLGALAMINAYTARHRLGIVAPLLILAVPLFDMLFVMWVRWRRGLPVMLGSPDHVALRLRKWRLSTRATVRANVAAAIVTGSAGVGVMLLPVAWAAALLAGLLFAAVALAVWLRRIDMSL
ncbi:MAG: undecaprenyl/decaprenyl-phosphate alpha-N-acetylglucosaminyl 1-phosphate transferase [Acidobacteria bacterium]|nr:MAG: undecaprenyl/decaprenyl-phosphate alpha-N-acetylglucosaminyl 1-phosphate transferase [Acidobacteriota bacterium]